jgi:hypothetical protein
MVRSLHPDGDHLRYAEHMTLRPATAVMLLLGTCLSGPAAADTNADIFEKAVRVMERAAEIVDANRTNCDHMGDKLSEHFDRNAQFMKDAKAMSERLSANEKHALELRFRPRIVSAVSRIQTGFDQCSGNAKVMAAIHKIN